MQYIQDPSMIEELESSAVSQAPSGAAPVSEYSGYGVYNADDGSVMDTMKSKWAAIEDSILAEAANPELSNYARKRLTSSIDQYKQDSSKLGVAGNLAASAPSIAATIGAGIVNPWAGGAVAMGIGTAEASLAQGMEGGFENLDMNKALGAGVASGLVDVAMGGMGNVARAALPAAKPLARVGINATEDVTSNVAAQAFENLAAGKDWDQDLAEAAVMGAGVGAGLRGSLAGLNKVRGTLMNKGGEQAIKDVEGFKKDGFTPNQTFADEAFGYQNQYADAQQNLLNARTPDEIATSVDAMVNMSAKGGGAAADVLAMKMAKEHNLELLDSSFDIDSQRGLSRDSELYNLGESMGLSKKEMQKAGEASEYARESRFGMRKAKESGLVKEADREKFQADYKRVSGIMEGSYTNNVGIVDELIGIAKHDPNITSTERTKLAELRSDLSALRRDMESYTGNKKTDVSSDIQISAKRALRNAAELGVMDKLTGVDGKPGSWDPVTGIMAIDSMERMGRSRMPSVHQGAPNKFKNKFLGSGTSGNMIDAGLVMTGNIPAAIARRTGAVIADEIGAKVSQGRLKKAKRVGTDRLVGVQRAMEARRDAALKAGDMQGAAEAAKADLEASGIATKSVLDESPVIAPEAVQAPVSAPVDRSAPLQPRTPKAPEKAIEEPVAPVVEPEPITVPEPEKTKPVPARKPTRKEKKAAKAEEAKAKAKPEMAKKPAKPKVEEPEPAKVEEPEVVATPEPEVVVEAPRSDSKRMAAKPKQPIKEEPAKAPEAIEAPSEAPAKSSSVDMVRAPLKKQQAEYEDLTVGQRQDMLKTDPAKYNDLKRAKEDIQLVDRMVDNLSSQHKMSKDAVADYINEMGGLKAIREDMSKKGETGKEQQAVSKRIRELETLKQKEAKAKVEELREKVKNTAVKEEAPKVDTAKEIADTHIAVREELDSLGYSKDTVDEALKKAGATDTTKMADPKIIKNWAKTIEKEKVAKAKADMEGAESKAKAVVIKPTIKTSKAEIDSYVKGIDAKDVPDVRDMIEAATKHRQSALTEAQMVALKNKIDRAVSQELDAYQSALSKPKSLTPTELNKAQARSDALKNAQKQLRDNEAKLATEKKAREVESKEAAKELEKTTREYEKLFKDADARLDKIEAQAKAGEKLEAQQKEMTEALMALGAPEATAQKILHSMFISRTEPLKDAEFSKMRAKAVQDLEKSVEAKVTEAKAEVKTEVAKLSDSQLEAAAKDAVEVSREVKDFSAPEVRAVNEAIADELKARGRKDEAAYMDAFNDIVVKAEENKKLFPNAKELWISADDKQRIQALMGRSGSAYMGNLGKQLSSRFYGDAEAGKKFMKLSDDEIKARVEAGKIDSDIVVAPKKSWKEISRKTRA